MRRVLRVRPIRSGIVHIHALHNRRTAGISRYDGLEEKAERDTKGGIPEWRMVQN